MAENKSVMRSVSDILRTYNFVNTPEGRRHTVRFFSGMLVLAAGGFMVAFIAFGGGNTGDTTFTYGSDGDDPYRIHTLEHPDGGYYIGYSIPQYDPDSAHLYSEQALDDALDERLKGLTIREKTAIRTDDGTLMGYHVKMGSGLGSLLDR